MGFESAADVAGSQAVDRKPQCQFEAFARVTTNNDRACRGEHAMRIIRESLGAPFGASGRLAAEGVGWAPATERPGRAAEGRETTRRVEGQRGAADYAVRLSIGLLG